MSGPLPGLLLNRTSARLLGLALGLLVVALVGVTLRASWLSQYDVGEAQTLTPTPSMTDKAPPVRWIELGQTRVPPGASAALTVQLCPEEGAQALEISDGQLTIEQHATPESDPTAEPEWSQPYLSEDELTMMVFDGCVGLPRRVEAPGGRVGLRWDDGAFGDRPDETISVRMASRIALGRPEQLLLILFGLAACLIIAAGQNTTRAPVTWRGVDAVAVLLVMILSPLVTLFIPVTGFLVMALPTIVYVGFTGWSAMKRRSRHGLLAALAFHSVSVRTLWVSALVGLGVAVMAFILLSVFPSGESHMTEIFSASGMLFGLAAMSLIAPWAEEIVLRGVVYGAIERRLGSLGAVVGSASVFSVLHLAQHWGSLGPWVVVSLTGLALSIVRWRTGSTVASTMAHLTYNLLLLLPLAVTG